METLQQNEQAEIQEPVEPVTQEPAVEGQPAEEEKINWRRFGMDLVETLLLALILFFAINAMSARVRVDGFSMRPTLEDGEFVLVSKLSYLFGKTQRGDIIVFHFPLDPKEELIKRVIGLPGDHVSVKAGVLYVNDQKITEPYIAATPSYSGSWLVDEGQLFVLGDNRNNSNDSKDWGLLPYKNVVGKAVLIYWPPPLWDVIQHPQLISSK